MISVIVPIYNVDKYLKECIDSIINQTYKDIEIILVDDGSTDESGKICDDYKKKNNNIKVIHKKNNGLGFARNSGMEIMTGEYVTFVDSDDYIESNLLEKMLSETKKYNLDICKTGFQRIDDNHNKFQITSYKNEMFNNDEVKKNLLPRMIGSSPEHKDSIEMCVWGVLYKTDIIKKYGIKFPSERELISEDLVFNINYLQHAKRALTSSMVGYNYRYNMNSLTKKYKEKRFDMCKVFYNTIKEVLIDYQYTQDTIYRLDRMFFINLRMCISQEKPSVSHKNKKEILSSINKICNDEQVKKIISEYPVQKLGFKQKMFIKLIDNKSSYILYLLCLLNTI